VPIQPVENQRLYRQIADQISSLIASGEFAEAARLPSERELAVQLGVSRPSVREALIALEVEGKVDVRVGSGIYVARRKPAPAIDPARQGQGPFELLRARWLIEGEIAGEAARTATVEDLARVRAAVEDLKRRQGQGRDLDPADRDFHLAIARSCHNSALFSVVRDLWDQGRGAIWKRMEHHFQTPQLRAAVFRDHRLIFEALESRDARGARSAMRRHLERVDREFTRGWQALKAQAFGDDQLAPPKSDAAANPPGRIRRVARAR
jgi:GntR family uxuAB operon transcriptional repressor